MPFGKRVSQAFNSFLRRISGGRWGKRKDGQSPVEPQRLSDAWIVKDVPKHAEMSDDDIILEDLRAQSTSREERIFQAYRQLNIDPVFPDYSAIPRLGRTCINCLDCDCMCGLSCMLCEGERNAISCGINCYE